MIQPPPEEGDREANPAGTKHQGEAGEACGPEDGRLPPGALVGAVREMLGAAGMPLDLERSRLLQGSLELKQELAALKVAARPCRPWVWCVGASPRALSCDRSRRWLL